jgi:hypothetical protein
MDITEMKNEVEITNINMINKLVELSELMELLGYTDERSIEGWCKKNKVPLFHIGKKTYTIRNFIDIFISEKMEQYVKANYKNAEVILKAIKDDDSKQLSEQINAAPEKATFTKVKKKADSKQATDFINKLKAA